MSPSPRRSKRESQGRPAGRGRVVSPTLAPGALELVQALVNTYDFASRVDELTTTGNLSAWLSRNGLLPAGAELSDADLSRIRAVRAGLRALVAAHSGSRVNEADVAALDQATIGARAQVRFERDGTSRLELGSSHFEDALGTLLGIVLEAERSGEWKAVKLCAHPNCRAAFFDFTKNGSGRWCMPQCGSRVRAQRHRNRRR